MSESHSDVDALVNRVRELRRVTASFMADTAIIHFEIDGQRGWLRLRNDGGVSANENRARAAARTQMRGERPNTLAAVRARLAQGIGNRALNILMDRDAYTVVGARWSDVAYGAQP